MDSFQLKNIIKALLLRRTFLYKETFKKLVNNQADKYTLPNLLHDSVVNVPYYREILGSNSSKPILAEFPILRKTTIVGNEINFVSQRYNIKYLQKKSTGGTSGTSINIYRSLRDAIIETAFVDYAFSLIDKKTNLRVGVLRGNKPKKGLFEKSFDQYVLSSYNISTENIEAYVNYIEEKGINCLTVYPTAITIFCKQILNKSPQMIISQIKGILSSSEILSTESKNLINKVFPNATLIDLYGQNEHVAFALSKDRAPYKFFSQYGYTEFVDIGIKSSAGNRIAEIVSTGFINDAMPLIRYGTEDYVEIDSDDNIVSIIGRTQDFLVNCDGELVPCIVLTRDRSLENVNNFQYYQEEKGKVIFRVIVNSSFSELDKTYIEEDINKTFDGKVVGTVEIVPSIEKTKAGKQRRLIQVIKTSK